MKLAAPFKMSHGSLLLLLQQTKMASHLKIKLWCQLSWTRNRLQYRHCHNPIQHSSFWAGFNLLSFLYPEQSLQQLSCCSSNAVNKNWQVCWLQRTWGNLHNGLGTHVYIFISFFTARLQSKKQKQQSHGVTVSTQTVVLSWHKYEFLDEEKTGCYGNTGQVAFFFLNQKSLKEEYTREWWKNRNALAVLYLGTNMPSISAPTRVRNSKVYISYSSHIFLANNLYTTRPQNAYRLDQIPIM